MTKKQFIEVWEKTAILIWLFLNFGTLIVLGLYFSIITVSVEAFFVPFNILWLSLTDLPFGIGVIAYSFWLLISFGACLSGCRRWKAIEKLSDMKDREIE